MSVNKSGLLIVAISLTALSGCASYRTSIDSSPVHGSTIKADQPPIPSPSAEVLVYEGDITDRRYETIGYIQVSVKKLTLFHADPTKEQANRALIGKAIDMGADAVINATYKSGIGLTTWGYIDAAGTAVRFIK